jgi:hypothetical protein
MKLRLIITCVAVLAASILPTVASAQPEERRGTFLSLPPDLTTANLQGHYPHRDPFHPHAEYRHRKLSTADNRGVDRLNGEAENIPAGELCDFPVRVRQWGAVPFWEWVDSSGRIVHAVANPDLRSKFSANRRSFWTIDEGWDYFWPNRDGTEFIEGTATHFWVQDKHRKFRMYGTWYLLVGPSGLQYEKYFRDKTSVWDGTIADIDRKICQFLAPAGG